jgi:hypothetical protein
MSTFIAMMNPSKTYEVRQNEIGMVSRRKNALRRETLFTTGLNPCVGVLLWDDNWIVLGHLQDSTAGSFETAYQAVIKKMRKDSDNSAVIYGGIAYHRSYDDRHTDHRQPAINFLKANGVVVQTDIVGSNEDLDNPSLRVSISRSGKYSTPQIKTTLKRSRATYPDDVVPKSAGVARTGQFVSRVPLSTPPAIAIVCGENEVETFDYASFTNLVKEYAR